MKKLFKYAEPNRKLRIAEDIVLLLILVGIIISLGYGFISLNNEVGNITPIGAVEMIRDESEEDYDEDYTVCDVIYVNGEDSLTISYSYEEYVELDQDRITAYGYQAQDGTRMFFTHENPGSEELAATYRQYQADKMMPVFNLGNALIILFLSVFIMTSFSTSSQPMRRCGS